VILPSTLPKAQITHRRGFVGASLAREHSHLRAVHSDFEMEPVVEQGEPLAGGELAAGVLLVDPLAAAHGANRLAARLEIRG